MTKPESHASPRAGSVDGAMKKPLVSLPFVDVVPGTQWMGVLDAKCLSFQTPCLVWGWLLSNKKRMIHMDP